VTSIKHNYILDETNFCRLLVRRVLPRRAPNFYSFKPRLYKLRSYIKIRRICYRLTYKLRQTSRHFKTISTILFELKVDNVTIVAGNSLTHQIPWSTQTF